MRFYVLRSSVGLSKWQDNETSLQLYLDVTPADQYQLEIGDKYIICGGPYYKNNIYGRGRKLIKATVSICDRPDSISHIKSEVPICGFAHFFEGTDGDFSEWSARLSISIVVSPDAFHEMLRQDIRKPGAANLWVSLEGLTYGPDPDGSHTIWNLGDDSDCGLGNRRRITSFNYEVETFSTRQSAIQEEEDRKIAADMAESPNSKDRERALSFLPPRPKDPVVHLLRQCRALLIAILVLGVLAVLLTGH